MRAVTSFITMGSIPEKIRHSIAYRHAATCNGLTPGILGKVARGGWHSNQQPAQTKLGFRHLIAAKESPHDRRRECFNLALACGTNLDSGCRTGYLRRQRAHQRIVEFGNAVTALRQNVIKTRVSVRTYVDADGCLSRPKEVLNFIDILRSHRTVHANPDCVRQG